jgi:hypothetical protein
MLGHSTATLTFDRYVHLFCDKLDGAANRFDATVRAQVADFRGPEVLAMPRQTAV